MQPESLELSHSDGPPLPSGRESFVPPLRSAGQQRDRLLKQIVTDPVTEERTGMRLRGDVGSEERAAVGGVVPPYVHVSGVDGCTDRAITGDSADLERTNSGEVRRDADVIARTATWSSRSLSSTAPSPPMMVIISLERRSASTSALVGAAGPVGQGEDPVGVCLQVDEGE